MILSSSLSVLPLVVPAAAVASLHLDPQRILGSKPNSLPPNGEKVREELTKAEIIPHVIDDFIPAFLLSVKWSSETEAELGNTLKPGKLKDVPTVTLTPTETTRTATVPNGSTPDMPHLCAMAANTTSNVTYAITLTDPDAPSYDDPKWSEFCHWIATGHFVVTPKLPPKALRSGDAEKYGDAGCPSLALMDITDVMEYKPPTPPKKTGKHRYVFLAFAPLNATSAPLNVTKPGERKHWGTGKEGSGVRDWADKNGLVPIAANFIYAQNKKQ